MASKVPSHLTSHPHTLPLAVRIQLRIGLGNDKGLASASTTKNHRVSGKNSCHKDKIRNNQTKLYSQYRPPQRLMHKIGPLWAFPDARNIRLVFNRALLIEEPVYDVLAGGLHFNKILIHSKKITKKKTGVSVTMGSAYQHAAVVNFTAVVKQKKVVTCAKQGIGSAIKNQSRNQTKAKEPGRRGLGGGGGGGETG